MTNRSAGCDAYMRLEIYPAIAQAVYLYFIYLYFIFKYPFLNTVLKTYDEGTECPAFLECWTGLNEPCSIIHTAFLAQSHAHKHSNHTSKGHFKQYAIGSRLCMWSWCHTQEPEWNEPVQHWPRQFQLKACELKTALLRVITVNVVLFWM